MEKKKNIEILNLGGIKCDSETCDWEDKDIPFEDTAKWLNKYFLPPLIPDFMTLFFRP